MLSVLRKLLTAVAIGVVFLLGMVTTVYLSLRSPIVNVPDIVGKDRFVAETELQTAGLNFRVRAARPSRQVKADTVMFQLPRAGESVKAGQTVAVDIARVAKEGEASETVVSTDNSNTSANNSNTTANSNGNENKPRRKPNANANANGNANNANGNANNGNRNTNAARPNANVKANSNSNNNNSATPRAPNANRTPQTDNGNANRTNRNVNRTPTPARTTPPKPTPSGNN